ncbi:MAG: hypothetical protein AB3X44_01060 [Leptothrix sp. (in: b-proteobacteria)]
MTSVSPASATADSAQLERLHYRRQFLLGPEFVANFPDWIRLEISPRLKLSAHPDLEVAQFTAEDGSITLLGFIFDAAQPHATPQDILQRLWQLREQPEALRRQTDDLGGRWVLVIRHGQQCWLVHDATGARQVCHMRLGNALICASQPGLIAELHELVIDPAAQDFVRARGDSDLDVYWLPGNRTLYREVRVLLPNHVLDLQNGQIQRRWPTEPLPKGNHADVLARSLATLKGFMAAAQRRRGGLSVPMTAGWDSRLVLAMSRPAASDLHCYTLIYPNQSRHNRDVAVPARLLRRLGLKHDLIEYPRSVDPAFRAVCQRSTYSGHTAFCADSQSLRTLYPAERLCLTGDVAEIVKCHYRLGPEHTGPLTAADLARLCGLPLHPFAIEALDEWLAGVPTNCAIDPLDLFCWEQMAGRWQALIRAEYDIVQESFAPLNCRSLLTDMLTLDESLRRAPSFVLLRELIEQLWPETLSEPVNPPEKTGLTIRLLRILGKLNVYRLIPVGIKDRLRRLVL